MFSVPGARVFRSEDSSLLCRFRIAVFIAMLGLLGGGLGCTTKKSAKEAGARAKVVVLAHHGRAHDKDGGKDKDKDKDGGFEAKHEPGHEPGESYDRIVDNPFQLARDNPLSTFSIDVDTASYSNVRRFLLDHRLPPKDAIRIEEFINYFRYDYPQPEGDHAISVTANVAMCPWNSKHQLVRIGLRGKSISEDEMPPRNLVFLVDTSGSMEAPNRLPLFKQALGMLVRKLNARDCVSIVTYAGNAGLALAPTRGHQHETIMAAIERLDAAGSTNGSQGLLLAYQLAQETFLASGVNRVILGTDGDFNVGVTGVALTRLIEDKRNTGVYLSVLGFGMGNLKNSTLEQFAHHGNGQYAYIDSFEEARKVFVEDIGTLVPIAKDVKVQVEFNPAWAQAYRLIGYENRLLANQDFNDDKKDAGDMGAGHTVTALYEIVPPGVQINVPGVDALKYQKKAEPTPDADTPELLTVKVRYIPPTETKSRLLSLAVKNAKPDMKDAPADFRFAAAIAAFGLVLRDSPHKGSADFALVQRLAASAAQPDANGSRAEFLRLAHIAQRLAGKE